MKQKICQNFIISDLSTEDLSERVWEISWCQKPNHLLADLFIVSQSASTLYSTSKQSTNLPLHKIFNYLHCNNNCIALAEKLVFRRRLAFLKQKVHKNSFMSSNSFFGFLSPVNLVVGNSWKTHNKNICEWENCHWLLMKRINLKNVNVWLIAIHLTLALSQYTVSTQFTVRVRSQIWCDSWVWVFTNSYHWEDF